MANQDLLLHDAKNCLHVLTVNLEAIQDGLIPLYEDTLFNLNQTLLTFLDILLQLVRGIESPTSDAENTVRTLVALNLTTHDSCRQEVCSQPPKYATCKKPTSPQVPAEDALNIVPVMRRLIKEMTPLFHKRKTSFSFEIKPAEVWVHVDPTSFERMLRNLFSNEEKYVSSGATVSGSLEVNEPSQALITFIDNGPGIDPMYLKDIFNRSQRGCVPNRTRRACTFTSNSNNPLDEKPEESVCTKKKIPKKTSSTNDEDQQATSKRANEKCCTNNENETDIPEGSGLGLYQVAQTIASMGGTVEVENCAAGGLKTSLSFPVDGFLA